MKSRGNKMDYIKRLKIFFILAGLILSVILPPSANGTILPIPPRPPYDIRKMDLTLTEHNVRINVLNNVCRVKTEETFYNPYDFLIEGDTLVQNKFVS
jgi:hypothetical protein